MSMERHLIAVFAPFGLRSLLRGGHLGGRGRVVVQVLPTGPACHPLLPTSHSSILGEPALARPLQKAPLLTSTYDGGV